MGKIHKKCNGRNPGVELKIKYISSCAAGGVGCLKKYFSDNLLSQVLLWKEERNRLIHALLKQEFAHNEVSELAVRGNELAKQLRTRSGQHNRVADKMKNVK